MMLSLRCWPGLGLLGSVVLIADPPRKLSKAETYLLFLGILPN